MRSRVRVGSGPFSGIAAILVVPLVACSSSGGSAGDGTDSGASTHHPSGGDSTTEDAGMLGSQDDGGGATNEDASGGLDATAGDDTGGGGPDGAPLFDAGPKKDSGASKDAGNTKDSGGGSTSPDAGPVTAPPQVPSGWTLALNDDFTGSTLTSNWNIGTDQGTFTFDSTTYWDTWVPAESEYPTASMLKVENSNLILSVESATTPISGSQGTKSYISGYANTYGNFDFQYGYIEIRAQMPTAKAGSQTGLWPALWMFNSTYANQDEIDIVESFGGDQTSIAMTVHDAAINQNNGTGDQVVVQITPGYHVFGALHQATSVSFYVDNKLEKTFNDALPSKMAINVGVQLGNASMGWISGPIPSNWGSGIHGANAPDMDIDWVHVWTE